MENIFNSHTLLDKNYTFNATKDELSTGNLEFKFFAESY